MYAAETIYDEPRDCHWARTVDEIGIEPIVFGSDFPRGEGLAHPHEYVLAPAVG